MIYHSNTITVSELNEGILLLTFCSPSKVNTLDIDSLKSLDEAIQKIKLYPSLTGLILNSDKDHFLMGANIYEFQGFFTAPTAKLTHWIESVNDTFNQIEDLPVPTVSLVNGYCLGGGCECSLSTDFRIGDKTTKIGLPETRLGIIPGFGGTVRLPRMIGTDNAAYAMLKAILYPAEKALALGLIDAVVKTEHLLSSAINTLKLANDGKLLWKQKRQAKLSPVPLSQHELTLSLSQAKNALEKKVSTHYKAHYLLIESLKHSLIQPRELALETEKNDFIELAKTQQAYAQVQLYLNDKYVKRLSANMITHASKVTHAAVIGAGVMGGAIAFQSAKSGAYTILKDIAEPALTKGYQHAIYNVEKWAKKHESSQESVVHLLSHIKPTLNNCDIPEADVIIEAIVENEEIKINALKEIEQNASPHAVITSNTSTIPITKLSESLKHPERFCGMHFFNPVEKMPLVEIIKTPCTTRYTLDKVVKFAHSMGKTPIVVNDCAGFFINRILFPYLQAFCRLVEKGYDFEHIDHLMEHTFGWPMGPAYLLDTVGIDVAYHAHTILSQFYPERMPEEDTLLLKKLLDENQLGQKTQQGFYSYTLNTKGMAQKAAAATLPIEQSVLKKSLTDEQIVNQLMIPLINETVRCLEENIIQSVEEGDLGIVYGLGFPTFRGGVFCYLDEMGISNYIKSAQPYLELGESYHIPQLLTDMAEQNLSFYKAQSIDIKKV